MQIITSLSFTMNIAQQLRWGGKSIPKERKRLFYAHEAGISYEQMIRLHGVKKDTTYRICRLRKYDQNPEGVQNQEFLMKKQSVT